jgi:Domain of unknown function (DUF5753)
VTFQVLSFNAGAHAGLDGEFTIFSFSEPGDRDVVYVENITADLYLEDLAAIQRYTLAFDYLRATALSPAESAALIAESAGGFGAADAPGTRRG